MLSNQSLRGCAAVAALVVLTVALCGCSHTRGTGESTVGSRARTAAATAAPAPDLTATEAAIAGLRHPGPEAASPTPAAVVNPTAPKQYTVKRGDTLWGISTCSSRDPWQWPEVWYINPKVQNPHLIYPGDMLVLAYDKGGHAQIRLEQAGALRLDPRLRSSPLDSAIPTIPYAAIAAFLSRPTLLTADEIRHAPYVLAFRDMHQIAGSGNEVYVRNLTADENARFNVMHVSDELRDPDDGKVLGYIGIYTATALVQRPGNPAKALLIDPARETLQGDRLLTPSDAGTGELHAQGPRRGCARPHSRGRRRHRPHRSVQCRRHQPWRPPRTGGRGTGGGYPAILRSMGIAAARTSVTLPTGWAPRSPPPYACPTSAPAPRWYSRCSTGSATR